MSLVEIQECVAKVPLFKDLSASERGALCKGMVRKHYGPGETIVHEDDEDGETFFIITSGTVHVIAMTQEGNSAILARLKKGDFFGEMTLLDGGPRSASVVAVDPAGSDFLVLYRHVFLDIVTRHPKIAIQLLAEMSRRLRKANRHINTLSLMSVYGRVADILLRLAKEQGRREGAFLVIPNRPTHQTIAEMACTTRETVSRIVSQLQKKQYIAIDRKRLVILNEEFAA